MGAAILAIFCLFLPPAEKAATFRDYMKRAEKALKTQEYPEARSMIDRALERDPKSPEAWGLRARWAEAAGEYDEMIYALHRQLRLAMVQRTPRKKLKEIREKLEAIDPIAPDLLDLKLVYVEKLAPIAKTYEKEGRPHSAIRIHNEILALDPERAESEAAIERIASRPDPSLADSARPKDLLEDVSEEWIRDFNKKHRTWKTRGRHVGENYTTLTDAGYEVMIRAAEAMERVNAFYRIFFDYDNPPRIELRIFKTRDEYLKLGSSPPEWSGGLFTGSAVETFVGTGGFDEMVRTLFHEVGHQFVSLAASGARSTIWLNEGLATYFEGTQVLANGSVVFNLPAYHYLFDLTKRLDNGYMEDILDGIDPRHPEVMPEKAPRLSDVVGCRYQWGPPWYAPVWGATFFFFNYQDPVDGRFVYRHKFREYIDKAGGRIGKSAMEKIESFILADPEKPTPGVDFSEAHEPLALPKTFAELDELWGKWLKRLRDEESGRREVKRPFHEWAGYAVKRGDKDQALEHFEKGLKETPDNVELLIDFARFLGGKLNNKDRASKLVLDAIRLIEFGLDVDEDLLEEADDLLKKYDPKWRALEAVHAQLWSEAKKLAAQYLEEGLYLMAMDVAWRFGTELGVPDILPFYEKAVRRSGKSLWHWKLAYNERNLAGWITQGGDVFVADGPVLRTKFGDYKEDDFNYQIATMDTVTTGDFSLEAEIFAEQGKVSFCGLLFGKKGSESCQAVILHPGGKGAHSTGRFQRTGFVDLTSFYGPGSFKIWRHNTLKARFPEWHTIRVDVSGRMADVYFDGGLVVTHEFPNLGVVRGGFGLICGVGEAKFRNIRYISRPARDFGARIEREVRMEKIRADSTAEGGGGSLRGSWLGEVPPFPRNAKWIQEPRTCWEEKGPVPTLIVFWSIEQEKLIPIHKWLHHLKEKHADAGLEIVSVASAYDEEDIEYFLGKHPFPGSLCLDRFHRKGYGELFELFGVQIFNLPRAVLLDVDHTVFWEGDPGFKLRALWRPGMGSYLDAPLLDLIKRRKVEALVEWHREWTSRGKAALQEGNLAQCAKLLLEARPFDGSLVEEVGEAKEALGKIRDALDSLEDRAAEFAGEEREPALEILIAWGGLVERSVNQKRVNALGSVLNGPVARDWTKALALARAAERALQRKGDLRTIESLVTDLEPLRGFFPRILRSDLSGVLLSGDQEEAKKILGEAESLPALWLAQEYFEW